MAMKRRPLNGKSLLLASAGVALIGSCAETTVGNYFPPPPELCVDSVPADAEVLVDGQDPGQDGCTEVFADSAIVTATAEGYLPFEDTVDVGFEGTTTFTVVMTEDEPTP